jgi:hypothetical protein
VAYDVHSIILCLAVLKDQTISTQYYRKFLKYHLCPALWFKQLYSAHACTHTHTHTHCVACTYAAASIRDLPPQLQLETPNTSHTPQSLWLFNSLISLSLSLSLSWVSWDRMSIAQGCFWAHFHFRKATKCIDDLKGHFQFPYYYYTVSDKIPSLCRNLCKLYLIKLLKCKLLIQLLHH